MFWDTSFWCVSSDKVELLNTVMKGHLYDSPAATFQLGEPVYWTFVVEIMMKVILATSSIILRNINCSNKICGVMWRRAIRAGWWERHVDGVHVWHTVETDGLIGFQGSPAGVASVLQRHGDYESMSALIRGALTQPGLRRMYVCTHTIYPHAITSENIGQRMIFT